MRDMKSWSGAIMLAMDTTAMCPGCRGRRNADDYLCVACWGQLPKESQEALYRQDGKVVWRYRQLLEACKIGAPLQFLVIR